MRNVRPIIAISFLLTGTLFMTTEAVAKQCVFNKGGYVLHVHWYHKGDLNFGYRTIGNTRETDQITNSRAPAKAEAVTAGFGSCNDTDEVMIALLSIPACGHVKFSDGAWQLCTRDEVFSRYTVITPGAPLLAIDRSSGHADFVSFSDWWAQAFHGYLLLRSYEEGTNQPGSIVLITPPSTTQYLDFWGGVQDVQWGPGGPIQ
jgi:hypothetical protein